MEISRRNFLKTSLMLALVSQLKIPNVFADSSQLKQKVRINLPSYTLTLLDYRNGNLEEKSFQVGIGKGCDGRKQTPINDGVIYEKREQVLFRYGRNYPNLGIKKGQVIRWTNTFDKNGKPEGYKMPYSEMRGLAMKIDSPYPHFYYDNFVIHSTTDEFTIGTPASGGCIRVGMKDMLKLYDIVRPKVEEGILKKPVPLEILYDLVELKGDTIKLHANVYHRKIDLIGEFKKRVGSTKFNEGDFDYDKMRKSFALANITFDRVHEQILEILSKTFPHNFIPPHLKKKLHKHYDLHDFLRA